MLLFFSAAKVPSFFYSVRVDLLFIANDIIGYNDKKSRLWLSNAVCCGCPVYLVLRKCGIVVMSLRILVNF